MVKEKKLNIDDFLSKLENLYAESENKSAVYLTFKRAYIENFKFKRNQKNRKLRILDRKKQDKETNLFNVLVRAKLRKKRIHTIVTPDEISSFHHNLMNVLILHFIREERTKKEKKEKVVKKVLSKTQKRKIKKLKKIKSKENEKMEVEKKP